MRSKPNWFIGWPVVMPLDLGPAPPRVRVFIPEDRHVTLAFLGACDEVAARTAWQEASGLRRPVTVVSVAGIDMLGNPRAPSAIAAILDAGRTEVERAIHDHRPRLLAAAQARADHRPLRAHVTLARVQRAASPIQRRNAEAWSEALSVSALGTLEGLALYTWHADRNTRLFSIVERQGAVDTR